MEDNDFNDKETWEELARPGFELNLNRAGTIYFTEVKSDVNENDDVICGAKPPENHHLPNIAEDRPQTARDIGMVFHKRAAAPDLISSLREANETDQVTIGASSRRWKKVVLTGGLFFTFLLVAVAAYVAYVELLEDDDRGGAGPGSSPEWQEWGVWTQCSDSCGGRQQRSRVCTEGSDDCEGLSEDERGCNTIICPITDPEGIWSTWQSWEECSQSCGAGTQVRSRECVNFTDQSLADDSCIGGDMQSRECNSFPCPDGGRRCNTGVLTESAYCRCSETMNGQVLSIDNLPLENVTITPQGAPYAELASSIVGGYFTLEGACSGDWYTFGRDGFVSVDVQLTELSQIVLLERFVPLRLVTVPMRNVVSVTGDRIQLCCEASGVPPPDYYEWMKDGVYVADGGILTIDETSPEDTGMYTCRASNDYSAITSPIVTVRVNDSPDGYCDPTPLPNIQLLPSGCTYMGSNEIDQGACPGTACYGGEINECMPVSTHCCTEFTFDSVAIECGDYLFDMRRVTSCGCGSCEPTALTVYGFAGGLDGTPLQNGSIFLNGDFVTNTSMYGDFVLTVDRGITHVSLLIVDGMSNSFLDYSHVFEMPSETVDSHFVQANMLTREHVFEFDSRSGDSLDFDSTTLDIPANSFYSIDGQQYYGIVTAAITSIDPVNQDEVTSAPGFNTINSEGDSAQLISYGMFAMVFEDSIGNRLSIPGEITIETTFPSSVDASQVRLWMWNPTTGSWDQMSELMPVENDSRRRKRQNGRVPYFGSLRGLTISSAWVNFDWIADETCVVKVRTFSSDSFLEQEQLPFSDIYVAYEEEPGDGRSEPSYSLSSVSVDTDSVGNGYCIAIPCSSTRFRGGISREYRGYIFANYRGLALKPTEMPNNGLANTVIDLNDILDYQIEGNKIRVRFDQRSLYRAGHIAGPFFDYAGKWRYSPICSNAGFDQNHFRFSLDSCLNDNGRNMAILDGDNIANTRLWYDISSNPVPWSYSTCYAKVKAPHGTMIKASSYKADDTHPSFASGDNRYGVVEDCSIDGEVCIQLRPPGFPARSAGEFVGQEELFTTITISTQDGDYPIGGINAALLSLGSHVQDDVTVGDYEFRLDMTSVGYGELYGIYCYNGPDGTSYRDVEEIAKNRCKRREGWAVEFGNGFHGRIDVIVLIESNLMAESVVVTFMQDLFAEIIFEDSNTRFAFVTFASSHSNFHYVISGLWSSVAWNPEYLIRHLTGSYDFTWYWRSHTVFQRAHEMFYLYGRTDARNFVLLISNGIGSTSDAANVRQMFTEEPVTARIIGINTDPSSRGLFAYTEGPEDQFSITDPNVARDVAHILQSSSSD